MHKWIVVLTVALLPSLCLADEVAISKSEVLVFKKPADFKFEVAREPDDQFRPSLKFSHFGADGWKDFGFKLFINKGKKLDLASDEAMRRFVLVDCDDFKKGSVEGASTLKKVPGPVRGYYCTFTDASMPPNEKPALGSFRNATVGFVMSGDFGFNVIAYSNVPDGPLFTGFLNTLQSLVVRQSTTSDP